MLTSLTDKQLSLITALISKCNMHLHCLWQDGHSTQINLRNEDDTIDFALHVLFNKDSTPINDKLVSDGNFTVLVCEFAYLPLINNPSKDDDGIRYHHLYDRGCDVDVTADDVVKQYQSIVDEFK